jgi:ketosteroid isomerase-like protein
MSENVEIVRSILAAWEKGDFSSADWADPEIEFEAVGGPDESRWQGIAAMSEAWGGMLDQWDDFRSIAEEFRELDDGRVLVLMHNEGRGKGSGITISEAIAAKSANLFELRGGRVTRLTIYWNREEAPGS